ncbi:MAG TPA: DUF1080 domain-containing protein [Pirellulaceae bacterium]|nr:DUF1080 domain-containing protein [Pirellulaceae bacterium]
MIRRFPSWALVLLTVAAAATRSFAQEESDATSLFNGKDLSGWTWVSSKEGVKAEEVWSVKDGVLSCTGKPPGYLRTEKDDYANYVLELEWRFPKGSAGGNSGVLLHTSTPGEIGIWPKSLEAQLFHENAGDIWVIGETCEIENAAERVKGRRHLNTSDGDEKPIGEWNQFRILCKQDAITLFVNGKEVNHVTKCSATKGAICLQSEGAPIEFRNIRLRPAR